MKLVIDATVAVAASATPLGFERFRGVELSAPSLIWVEATSALHAMAWRQELTAEQAEAMRDRILAAPVRAVTGNEVALEAWRVADEFGWAKTYDAQYVALAAFSAASWSRSTDACDVERNASDSSSAPPRSERLHGRHAKFRCVLGRLTLAPDCIA